MNHNQQPSSNGHDTEKKKKKKLSRKQRLMGTGAVVSVAAALGGGYLAGSAGSGASKVTKPQGIEITNDQHGKKQFEQALDPNTDERLVSEGIDAPTPEESLQELFNAMGHDYRILNTYANLTGAYASLPEALNSPDGNASILLDKDGKSLSKAGKQILGFVERTLTDSLSPGSYSPGGAQELLSQGGATVKFIDLKDAILNQNWGPLYITGMDKNGFVRAGKYNTFGNDTKALWISYPDPNSEGGWSSVTVALSGGQPVLDNMAQIDSIPRGHTEADGHQQILPAYD